MNQTVSKPAVASKTVWWNIFVSAAQFADWAVGTGLIPQPYGALVAAAVNILLRFVTKAPISGIVK
jgi:hypothetical protein